jgi:hypothetical protein
MPVTGDGAFEALDPFFEVVMECPRGLVDGKDHFDTFAEDAIFVSRYHFPGWPAMIRRRTNLMADNSILYRSEIPRFGEECVRPRLISRLGNWQVDGRPIFPGCIRQTKQEQQTPIFKFKSEFSP